MRYIIIECCLYNKMLKNKIYQPYCLYILGLRFANKRFYKKIKTRKSVL